MTPLQEESLLRDGPGPEAAAVVYGQDDDGADVITLDPKRMTYGENYPFVLDGRGFVAQKSGEKDVVLFAVRKIEGAAGATSATRTVSALV